MVIRVQITVVTLMVISMGHQCELSYAAKMEAIRQSTTTEGENENLINEIQHEKLDKLITPNYQTMEVRLPSNTLLKYTSYKDVSILHFRMPSDTRQAQFTFKASEELKSTFHRICKPREITLHLKASSYPVISPENIKFPSNFLNSNQRFKIYTLQFQSDEVQQHITIDGPQDADWFAVAFLSWTDPKHERIEQQGLAASCDTLLMAEMSVSRIYPIILSNGQTNNNTLTRGDQFSYKDRNSSLRDSTLSGNNPNEHPRSPAITNMDDIVVESESQTKSSSATVQQHKSMQFHENNINNYNRTVNNEAIYKFYVPRNVGSATASIAFDVVCPQCPSVGFHVQANAFPGKKIETDRNQEQACIYSTYIKVNHTDEISITFNVQPMVWHYVLLQFVSETKSSKLSNEQLPFSGGVKAKQFELKTDITSRNISYKFRIDFFESSDNTNKSGVRRKCADASNVTQNESKFNPWKPSLFRDMEFYPLLRQTYREFFTFDYDLIPDENGTVPTVLNLTSGISTGFSFRVGEINDIGGTLSFALSMKHDNNVSAAMKSSPVIPSSSERSGILAEKRVGKDTSFKRNEAEWQIGELHRSDLAQLDRTNQTIIICMHHGEPGEPKWPNKCQYGDRLLPASSIVNNTDSNTNTGLIHVPFPEAGLWYITMGLYCHSAETAARATIIDSVKIFVKKYFFMLEAMRHPCPCKGNLAPYKDCVNDSNCLTAMNETDTLKIKECLIDSKCTSNHIEMTHKFEIHQKSTEQHFALENCTTSVVFTISSSPCIAGRCGRFGRCFHYMSGGFVFSTCVCMKGYRGWDCTEDSQVPSSMSILFASLLLIFSNLLFIPSIYMAIRRNFYTEAVVYSFAMLFSIFYHACDSGEEQYSFCLVKIDVLQFCDFYCGLLAIWVTLVAMSHIHQQFVSLLHMLGAIMLAFATGLNKQSLWAFLAPALTGLCLICTSWGMRCYKSRKWFPVRKYLTVYMPMGIVLAMVGLVCFAFLQTKQNYHIVHSVWHMVMALSIQCLLPSPKSFISEC